MDSRGRRNLSIVFTSILTAVLIIGGLLIIWNAVNVAPATADAAGAPLPGVAAQACDFAALVGKPVDEAMPAVLETSRPYRVLTPGSVATMDYSPARINIITDEQDVVKEVTCG